MGRESICALYNKQILSTFQFLFLWLYLLISITERLKIKLIHFWWFILCHKLLPQYWHVKNIIYLLFLSPIQKAKSTKITHKIWALIKVWLPRHTQHPLMLPSAPLAISLPSSSCSKMSKEEFFSVFLLILQLFA